MRKRFEAKSLGSEGIQPGPKIGNQGVENFLQGVAIRFEVGHRGGDCGAGWAAFCDPIEDFLQSVLSAIVTEPVIGDAGVKVVGEFGGQPLAVGAEFVVALIEKLTQGKRMVLAPGSGKKVVEADVENRVGEASALTSEKLAPADHCGMIVGEAVDRPVSDDAGDDFGWKIDFFWSSCHEVAEEVANPGCGVVFGEKQVGEIVQGASWHSEWPLGESETGGLVVKGSKRQAFGMQGFVWQDGGFCEQTDGVPIDSRGFTHGLGIFETMLAVDGQLVASAQHLKRLETSCGRLGLLLEDGMFPAIEVLLNRKGRQRIRLQVSAGAGPLNELDGGGEIVTLQIAELGSPPESVSAVWSPWPRNERSPLVGLKSVNYAENLLALDHARRSRATTALFLNTRREVCEAATANLFMVTRGVIKTPPLDSGCLPGTARERVIELARMLGVEAEETALSLDDVEFADELFLTSATQGVVPLTELEGRSVEAGRVTRSLQKVFNGK